MTEGVEWATVTIVRLAVVAPPPAVESTLDPLTLILRVATAGHDFIHSRQAHRQGVLPSCAAMALHGPDYQ